MRKDIKKYIAKLMNDYSYNLYNKVILNKMQYNIESYCRDVNYDCNVIIEATYEGAECSINIGIKEINNINLM